MHSLHICISLVFTSAIFVFFNVPGHHQEISQGFRSPSDPFFVGATTAPASHDIIISVGKEDDSHTVSSCCQGITKSSIGNDSSTTFGVYDRPFSDHDLLRGFKANIVEGEDAFKQKVFHAKKKVSRTSYTHTTNNLIEELDHFVEITDAKGSASLSLIPLATVTGQLSFFKERSSTKYKKTFMFHTRRVAYSKTIDLNTIEYVDEAKDLHGDEIAELYGTQFVQSIQYGAELEVYHTITSTEEITIEFVEGELGVRIGVCPFCLKFNIANFRQTNADAASFEVHINTEMRVIGIDLIPPQNPSYEQTLKFIDDFNTKYDELYDIRKNWSHFEEDTNLLNHFSPVAFNLGSITDYDTKLDASDIATFERNMREVKSIISVSLYWKAQLLAMIDTQENIYMDAMEKNEIFMPYKRAADNVISRLDDKVKECLRYRRLPFSTLVGRSESGLVMPEEYPNMPRDVAEIDGLLGKAYIASPLKIGTSTFNDLHYVGFARFGDDGQLKPWIKGSVRNDRYNEAIDKPNTPEHLEVLAYAWEHNIIKDNNENPDHVMYDEQVYIQLNSDGKPWLSSEQLSTKQNLIRVVTNNVPNVSEAIWNFRSDASMSADPKSGQCLKYNDVVFLQNGFFVHLNNTNFIQGWLGHDHDNNGVLLFNPDFKNERKEQARWIVRSSPEIGHLSEENNAFRAPNGERNCVPMSGNIYLQNLENQSLWLMGGHDDRSKDVITSDALERKAGIGIQNYRWTLKSDTDESQGFDCGAVYGETFGDWVYLPPSHKTDKYQTIAYERGIVGRENYLFPSWEQSVSWEKTVYKSISAGLTFRRSKFPRDEMVVNYVHSTILARSIEVGGDLTETSLRQNYTVGRGAAWQFILEITDVCVPAWQLKTGYIIVTDSIYEPPCCLPGMELDADMPHGPCRLNSPCMCDDDICNPPSPPTRQPTTALSYDFFSESESSSESRRVNEGMLALTICILVFFLALPNPL